MMTDIDIIPALTLRGSALALAAIAMFFGLMNPDLAYPGLVLALFGSLLVLHFDLHQIEENPVWLGVLLIGTIAVPILVLHNAAAIGAPFHFAFDDTDETRQNVVSIWINFAAVLGVFCGVRIGLQRLYRDLIKKLRCLNSIPQPLAVYGTLFVAITGISTVGYYAA